MQCLEANKSKNQSRHYGIDLLRIIAMYMVVILHTIGHTGLFQNCTPNGSSHIAGLILQVLALCAVNCYALISGYVSVYSKFKYTHVVVLWLQVLLYSIGFAVVFCLFVPGSVTLFDVLRSFLPITMHKGYWYFACYIGVYFLMPLLNPGIQALTRKQAKWICVTIVLFFSVVTTLTGQDFLALYNGYSVIWLMLLYVIGGCIRRFDFLRSISKRTLVVCYLVCTALTVGAYFLIDTMPTNVLHNFYHKGSLTQYTAPTILFCGISLFLICCKVKITSAGLIKWINFLSRGTFGVYLIHMQPQVYNWIFKELLYKRIPVNNPLVLGASVLGLSLLIFVVCNLIDNGRRFVFDKLKIQKRIGALEEKFLGKTWSETESS